MPFKPTPGLIIIVIVGVLAFVGIIAAVASSGGAKPQQKGQATITVTSEVGLAYISITNQNVVGATTIKTVADLPYSFNITIGDTIQLNGTSLPDYRFINWEFLGTGTFNSLNPLTIRPTGNMVIMANLMVKEE